MAERRDATRRADTAQRLFSPSARTWVNQAQAAPVWKPDAGEIARWSKRNQLVREIYFVEEALKKQKSSHITKVQCWVKACTTKTSSKSGLCRTHTEMAKRLDARGR